MLNSAFGILFKEVNIVVYDIGAYAINFLKI
jgi:hypothetical protein